MGEQEAGALGRHDADQPFFESRPRPRTKPTPIQTPTRRPWVCWNRRNHTGARCTRSSTGRWWRGCAREACIPPESPGGAGGARSGPDTQDALYATELHGGKAKVFLSFEGLEANRRFRALRQHREEIDGKVNGTILWLDEMQGGWEYAVLLERDEAFHLRVPD